MEELETMRVGGEDRDAGALRKTLTRSTYFEFVYPKPCGTGHPHHGVRTDPPWHWPRPR